MKYSIKISYSITLYSIDVEMHWEWNTIQDEFSKINPRRHSGLNANLQHRNTVYISIVADNGTEIVNCRPKVGDQSIIVTATGEVRNTQYGSIWVDNEGQNHMR